jgi:hypothetical protein
MDISFVRQEFSKRGVRILPPATAEILDKMETIIGESLPLELRAYFEMTSGFDDDVFDDESMIYLWPASEIVQYCVNGYHDARSLGIPFGDIFVGAEIIVAKYSEKGCPLFILDRPEKLADSPMQFLEGLLAGRYDSPR